MASLSFSLLFLIICWLESHFYLDISRGNWIDCYCCRCADNWNRGVARLVACVNPSRHGRWNCFDGIVPALVHDDPFVAPFTQRPKSFLSGLTRDCALQCLVLLLAQQQKPTHPLSTGTAGRWEGEEKNCYFVWYSHTTTLGWTYRNRLCAVFLLSRAGER